MYWNTKKMKRQKMQAQFGKNPLEEPQAEWTLRRMDKIKLFHDEVVTKKGELGVRYQDNDCLVDDITWEDLEMDDIFVRVNCTRSFMGEQLLYHRLRNLEQNGENLELEGQIAYLTEKEETRIDIEEKLAAIGKKEEDYFLPSFLMHAESLRIEKGFILHLLQILLLVFLLGSILWEHPLCELGLLVVAITNLMLYLYMKQRYEVYLFSLGSLKELLRFCRWMLADETRSALFATDEVKEAVKELKKLSKMVGSFQERKYASMSGDLMYLLRDYLMGITLLDVATFNHIMKLIEHKQDKVLLLYEFAGKIDMAISIASFRMSLDTWCVPTMKKETDGAICGQAIAHPLLTRSVANDFVLKNRAMITGANASGKSTFMKAVAVNVILAQTIHTCAAKEFELPKLAVMTSMSLRDDILAGESYYVRETRYLKRMLDVAGKMPTLFVIDEILKGTNTKERLAASAAILDYLAQTDNYVLIATHDMELVWDMQKKYAQFYFESQMIEDDISFDYRIHEGIGGNSNAIALLSLLHFPKEIIEMAKRNLTKNR